MNTEVNDTILAVLEEQTEPVERRDLQVISGILEIEDFNNALSYLEKNGKIVINRKKVGLPQMMGYVSATVVRQAKGFSFARPQNDGMEDIYINSQSTKGAMPGDTVLLKNIKESAKGLSGEVDKILEKGKRIITGTVERMRSGGSAYLTADSGFSHSLKIVRGGELKSKNGDKVKASIFYDSSKKSVQARVIKVYGSGNSAKICSDAIIDSYGIPTKFPVPVKHEAAIAAAQRITEEEMAKRTDFTGEPVFTIDGADAKDLDDAICVKKLENGWELQVHIADVSHYVTSGSKLDEEAQRRGTSVYFADRVIPMLPEEISNGCCSLNAGTKKLTFSAIMTLNEKAELTDYRFEKGYIISKVRGVYSEVNAILDGSAGEDIREKYAPVSDVISEAEKLANILKEKSARRGELDIESSELRFVLDKNGVCVDVAARERGEAEEIIEQFMIMANNAAALYAKSAGIPFVYRVHEAPDSEKLYSLAELAASCGFQTRRLRNGVRRTDLSALINEAKDTKYSRLISMQVLRSMAKAKYSSRPVGHFGLSLADYCHFTSPIRRYPDTSIHRILSELVSGVPTDIITKRYSEFVDKSAELSSDFEIRAVRAERDAEKCYAAEYMNMHIGERYGGVVSGASNNGIFVMLANGIEGFVRLTDIAGSNFEFDGMIMMKDRVSGKCYSVGDEVNIEVIAANVASGMIDFSLL